jgi:FixJ family two-component response regulator
MALVVIGLQNNRVGSRLGISEITVKKDRGNAMRKMKAETLPELVKMATRLRLPQASADDELVAK